MATTYEWQRSVQNSLDAEEAEGKRRRYITYKAMLMQDKQCQAEEADKQRRGYCPCCYTLLPVSGICDCGYIKPKRW